MECIDGMKCKSSDRPDDILPCNEFACHKLENVRTGRTRHNRRENSHILRNNLPAFNPAPPVKPGMLYSSQLLAC